MYLIKVEEFKEVDERGNEKYDDVYFQKVEELDLLKLITFINNKNA